MKTKKILAAIAALAIVCGAVPTQPFAEIIGNMAITASAETKESDFDFSGGVIWGYYGSDTEVVIPSTIDGVTVTSIGECAFLSCENLTSITIPDSVTSIGDNAFQGCESLSTIKMNSVETIGNCAFQVCTSLSTIKMNSVETIGYAAFQACTSLATVKMNSVTSIGYDAFLGCSSLDTIKMNSVTSIGESAFFGCSSLASVTLGSKVPDGFDEIPANAEIIVPCTLKGDYTIANAISNGAKVTYNHVFAEDAESFDSCVCGDIEAKSCGDNAWYLFDKATGKLTISGTGAIKGSAFAVEYADDKEKEFASDIKTVVIENGITSIGIEAFSGCSSLASIEMKNVTSIGELAFADCSLLASIEMNSVTSIGDYAFYKCSSLTDITASCALKYDESLWKYGCNATVTYKHLSEGVEICDNCKYIKGNCGENATYEFDKLTGTLTISGTGAVKRSAFDAERAYDKEKEFASDIKTVVIENGITSIGGCAFQDCTSLTTVEMSSVTSIGLSAFYECSSLTDITASCALKYDESLWKDGCNANVTYTHLSEGVEICDNCKYIKGNCGAFNEETVEYDDVTYIFDKATGKLTISGEGAIGQSAFDSWNIDWYDEIKTVVIENGITSIGEYAFYGCLSLTTVEMSNAAYIEDSAFAGCDSLKTVTLGSEVPEGFAEIPASAEIIVPCTLKENDTITNAIGDGRNITFSHVGDKVTAEYQAATCTEVGHAAGKYCSECNEVLEGMEGIKPTGHTEVTIEGTDATCTETGLTEGKHCSVCKEVLVAQEVIPPTGHTEVTIEGTDATCTETGLTEGKHCSVCKEVLVAQEVIPPTGHTEVTIEGTDATCTEDGLTDGKYCSVCETVLAEQEEISATGHTPVSADNGIDATCETDGKETDTVCGVCGAILKDGAVIPATGHNYVNGECTACGNRKGNCGVVDYKTWEYANNATYVFDKTTGTLTISGTGAIGANAFDHDEFDWVTAIKEVVIGDGITEIDQYAFYECTSLTTVKMNSVTSIGDFAFDSCSSLETVEMNSVISIGVEAFYACDSLTSVEMNSVTSIDYGAFQNCTSLTSVTLGSIVPDGLDDSDIPKTAKLIIPAEAYENYKDSGYNLGFSDIKGIGYILEGQIGIRLATDLSADKLVVMCGEKEITLTQKDGYVEFYVAAQDMAKEYTVYYADGEIEIAKFNPKSNLSGYEDTEYKAVAEALITYCETANAYFNGGEIADMSSEYDDIINAITPNTVDMGEDYDSSSLILESNTIVRHYYTEDAEGRIKKGNYYYVEEAVDPTKFARIDTYSVNDYIYKVLNSDKADANLKNLCVTLYKYGVAAETLKNGGNK